MAEALAHYSMALISETTLGGSDAARMHLRETAASDPSNLKIALKVASGNVARKEYDEAIKVLQRTLVYHPKAQDVRLVLGIAYQLNQQSRLAEREYRTVIRLSPTMSEPYIRLSSLYIAENEPQQALEVVDKALEQAELKAALSEFCESMGRLYLIGGQPQWAIPFLERLARMNPDQRPIQGLLAQAQIEAGHKDAAEARLLDLAWRYPEDFQTAMLLGELYEDDGDNKKAASYYERAVRVKPGDTMAVLRLANIQLRTNPEQSLRLVEEAVRQNPHDPAALAFLAMMYSRLERFDEAIRLYASIEALTGKGARESNSLQSPFYFWYGSACERAGRFSEAERLLGRCIELDPEADQALNYLAYMWAERGINLDKALEYATRAVKLAPEEGAYLDTLGWVYYQRGEYGKALDFLKKAARRIPDDPVVCDHLGDTWDALKEPGKARYYWQKSVNLEPGKLVPAKGRKE